ncbi:MAG: hypothetical protein SW833_26145 [Cyanobacteriota bacterium]|nr:hypothetical protein [Cyanobacteriota bacterium]
MRPVNIPLLQPSAIALLGSDRAHSSLQWRKIERRFNGSPFSLKAIVALGLIQTVAATRAQTANPDICSTSVGEGKLQPSQWQSL